jgi:cell wall-associated NlpC family hydrolase
VRIFGIASLLTCISLPLIAQADETINLNLPSSHAPAPTETLITLDAIPGATQSSDAKAFAEYIRKHASQPNKQNTSALNHRFASRGGQYGSPKEKVVGKLGVTACNTQIHSGRSLSKRTLAKVPSGTYIALNTDNGDWYGVLMADKSTGWVRKADVKELSYEVVTPQTSEQTLVAGDGIQSAPGIDTALLGNGQKTILETAYSFLGVPYKYGGNASDGIDCSAFVQRCFKQMGISLPRTAHEQINCGMPVSTDQLRAADRVYFASRGGFISHTGIYIGNGYFIHASSKNHGVSVSNLSEPLYQKMFAGARR